MEIFGLTCLCWILMNGFQMICSAEILGGTRV